MKQQLKFLLIQVRDERDGPARQHEAECLRNRLNIASEQLHILNVFEHPLDTTSIHGFDAVFIGGSGHCSVIKLDQYAFTTPLQDILFYACDRQQPVFGLCWGCQFMAQTFGGHVEKQIENKEVGSFTLHLTHDSQHDPVFSELPASFWVHLGHVDFMTHLGTELINLAYTEQCSFQAIRHKKAPLYGTQFHPELDKQALIFRIDLFRGDYLNEGTDIDGLKASLQDTPHSCRILDQFIAQHVIPYHHRRLSSDL